MKNHTLAKAAAGLAFLLSAAQAGAQAQPQTHTQAQGQTATQAQMPATDGQIAEIMRTANEGEIMAAQLAKVKGASPEVKEFAKHMSEEHMKNMKQQKELAQKTKMKPESNEVSKTLESDAKTKMADLKKLKGAEFDRTYMDQQVAMHQKVSDDLSQRLIPAAKDPQFKQFLQTTQTHVQEHLAKAKEIQSTLQK